jgi:hypothetical protein
MTEILLLVLGGPVGFMPVYALYRYDRWRINRGYEPTYRSLRLREIP